MTLDDQGHEAGRYRSPPFFDPRLDPVTDKASSSSATNGCSVSSTA
ncbi:MAG: hypothetical protein U0802_24075 [Candidatus Binatia bacterium]